MQEPFDLLFSYLNQGWVGILIGITATVIVGWIFRSKERTAKLCYQTSSFRILDRERDSLPQKVTILFEGQVVERLRRTTLIFWNNGTEFLDGKNIVADDKIRISFEVGDNILSYTIAKRTNEQNKFTVIKDEANPHQLLIDFDYLNQGDGVVLEIAHDSKNLDPKLCGSIKGLPKGVEDLGYILPTNSNEMSDCKTIVLITLRSVLWSIMFFGISLIIYGILMLEGIKQAVFIVSGILIVVRYIFFIFWENKRKYPKSLKIE